MTGELPLEGITVVSLEQAVAAPFATRTLADLGARVIKLERPDGGDFARHYDTAVGGALSSHFFWLNRGKESVAVDVRTPEGRAVLHDLVARADVVVQNLAPGSAARLGLSAAELRSTRADLVVVDLSGYGSDGPYRERRAYDLLVQAEAGVVSVTGTPDHPAKTGVPTADIAAGLHAAHAVLAALVRRGRTGEGAAIEVSMFDSLVEWMGHPLYVGRHAGRSVGRHGLAHATIVPYDAYPTRDGQVLVGVQNDRQWVELARALGRADLEADPALATNLGRTAAREHVDREVGVSTSRLTSVDLLDRLEEAGVPAARITDVTALADHPQLAGRDRWVEVGTPHGVFAATLPPAVFADVAARMGPVPALGEHTDAVLAELGLDAARVAALRVSGVVA